MEWILILIKGFFRQDLQDFLVQFKGMDSYFIFQAFLKKLEIIKQNPDKSCLKQFFNKINVKNINQIQSHLLSSGKIDKRQMDFSLNKKGLTPLKKMMKHNEGQKENSGDSGSTGGEMKYSEHGSKHVELQILRF